MAFARQSVAVLCAVLDIYEMRIKNYYDSRSALAASVLGPADQARQPGTYRSRFSECLIEHQPLSWLYALSHMRCLHTFRTYSAVTLHYLKV